MIDIHHHLLFGLDDGSPDIDTSVAMAEAALADGITHIVCTPHANDNYRYRPEVNQERLAALRERLGDRVTLGLGCDFHLSYENIADSLKNPTKYTINGSNYLLVEFPDFGIAPNMTETFYQMELARMTPILTHPERNPTITHQPERLAEWVRKGCLIQVTAGALTGRFGKIAERFSNELLRKNWVHFLASDAHNLTSRPPQLSKAYEYVAAHYGTDTAERLCITNPRAAFNGDPWPDQPEATGLYPEEDHEKARKRSFFGRLFSR
jgi:protein-tyrosine phosphatase